MAAISRILVPVDFSGRCLGMMPYTRAIAERYKAEVVLLHVVNPVYTIPATGISSPVLVPAPQEVFEKKMKQLEGFANAELRGISVRRLVYEGDPESQIAAFAQAERVELIVMPTHGYGVLRRYLIGSVTAKVLHDVMCPVLTGVHMEYEAPSAHVRISNMVCALDLHSRSRETLQWAARLAADFAAKLHVIHVLPSPSPGLYVAFSSSLQQEMEKMAREDIKKLEVELAADSVSICIQEGDVARQVCSFTHSIGGELLVIGRGAEGDKIERLRTNSYAIIRQAPCPVFSV